MVVDENFMRKGMPMDKPLAAVWLNRMIKDKSSEYNITNEK
jgi:hypothetical protein